jgi:cell filamentation protein
MALQAKLPLFDFNPIAGRRRAEYFAAIQAGMDRNYRPMTKIFEELIERSVAET